MDKLKTKDIIIFLKDGSELIFNNVEPFKKTKAIEKSEQDLLEQTSEDKPVKKDALTDYIHNDYFVKFYHTSATTKDKNFVVFLKENLAGVSITESRYIKPAKKEAGK